jgi:hypothetical protein
MNTLLVDRCVSHFRGEPVKPATGFPLYREAVTKIYANNQRNISNSNQVNAIGGLSVGEPAEKKYML